MLYFFVSQFLIFLLASTLLGAFVLYRINLMVYASKNFTRLLGAPGFSETLLQNHFTLYEGYVKNVNLLADMLAEKLKNDSLSSPEYAELKRRFGWEWNGMRLHELYFGNMTKEKTALETNSTFYQLLPNNSALTIIGSKILRPPAQCAASVGQSFIATMKQTNYSMCGLTNTI